MNQELTPDTLDFRISKDLKAAASTLTDTEARFLVDTYYQMQHRRIQTEGQIRAIDKSTEESGEGTEPHAVLDWMATRNRELENSIKAALGLYAKSSKLGRWAQSVVGIGPVISAGLIANIDITQCPTVGHIWSFAGMNPEKKWEKKTKRPWNASLKCLCCFKIGESFVKVQNRDGALYGQIFAERKKLEWQRNLNGDFADQALAKAGSVGKSTNAHKWYSGQVDPEWAKSMLESGKPFPEKIPAKSRESTIRRERATETESTTDEERAISCESTTIPERAISLESTTTLDRAMAPESTTNAERPMLPPAHIHARARRYAAKLFLSHYHHVAFMLHYNEQPPKPYILTQDNHTHMIEPPGLDSLV